MNSGARADTGEARDVSTLGSHGVLEFAKKRCVDIFTQRTGRSTAVATPLLDDEIAAEYSSRSQIMMIGERSWVRLELLYSVELTAGLFASKTVSASMVKDYFNELCNMTIGQLKERFLEASIPTALSLPFVGPARPHLMERAVGLQSWLVHDDSSYFAGRVTASLRETEAAINSLMRGIEAERPYGDVEFF